VKRTESSQKKGLEPQVLGFQAFQDLGVIDALVATASTKTTTWTATAATKATA
jgi:hypothetical protein